MESRPLLKFREEKAFLAPEGLALVKSLRGPICPIIIIGDGRGGKSYLASRVLDNANAFASSDSAEPVTEGIDIVVEPVASLLKGCGGAGADVPAAQWDEHLLILDCEGGNNAMAAIRTLVNVFGILLATQVIFVSSGFASEQALHNLVAALAARSLVRLDQKSHLPTQRLCFVVNKNTLRYDSNALESILNQKFEDATRQELRDTVKAAFPQRSFLAVPMMGMPDFEDAVQKVRRQVLATREPLRIGGELVGGVQLSGLMELVVEEVSKTNEVSFPSMNRFVIFDGFLMPNVKRLVQELRDGLPTLEDYDPELGANDPRPGCLAAFDAEVSHVAHKELIAEARALLQEQVDAGWEKLASANDLFGEQVKEIVEETKEVFHGREEGPLGGQGLLKNMVVSKMSYRLDSRSLIQRKKGGVPECSEWKQTVNVVVRFEEAVFNDMWRELPVLRGTVGKKSPNILRALVGKSRSQERTVILKDGHFIWWDTAETSGGYGGVPPAGQTPTPSSGGGQQLGAAKGCINFLMHRAHVKADSSCSSSFTICPRDPRGWSRTTSFSGDQMREFQFEAMGGDISRDAWVAAIQKHIAFGEAVENQVGSEKVASQVGIYKPTCDQVGT